MVESVISTEKKIKEAAIKIFTQKGKAGARMQDIADEAQINKAMLHYYFRSKDKLFELVFEEKLIELFSAFQVIIDSDLNFEAKLRKFVSTEIDLFRQYPMLPMFVLNEVGKNPEMLENKYSISGPKVFIPHFKNLVENEIQEGRIRQIDYRHLLMNLMSLCIYPILAKPIIKKVMNMSEEEFDHEIKARKKYVADLLLNDLK